MTHYTRDAEFLRGLLIVPFDQEAEEAANRQREYQASRAFSEAQEREDALRTMRALMIGLGFSFCMFAGIVIWCLL